MAHRQSNGSSAGDDASFMSATQGPNGNSQAIADAALNSAAKPKRVRTGCLTCRERHLKCDEALPNCMNCRKSARVCRRGIRLNFIDTQCQKLPVIASPDEWRIEFVDESREIASEYRGGLQRYAELSREEPDVAMQLNGDPPLDFVPAVAQVPAMSNQSLPALGGDTPENQMQQQQDMTMFDASKDFHGHSGLPSVESTYSTSTLPSRHSNPTPHRQGYQNAVEITEKKEYLNSQEETLFLQVFVEEVGIWMDSMDSMKHFSRLLPFHALGQPMLLNAFLACGARHLTLVNPVVYEDGKALTYYDAASNYLLQALQNPERDSVICATTAVILNVYEIMTEKALPRMNHIAGARALIKECGWNAKSVGIGAACFWLNVGMELLSNLHFNWQASWQPDAWGLDLDLSQETEAGREEIWTHRIVYITAKISDFRATASKAHNASPHNEHLKRQKRFEEWTYLKSLADTWSQNIPRTMQPVAYLYPYQTSTKSAFPEVWLIKRSTIVARLFYHTAMLILAQTNPLLPKESPGMHEMEQQHAHQICGIVAHVKDRGVASVALRSLHHAAECLTNRREQEEVLAIFVRIHKETGWRIGFIPEDLSKKWGWRNKPSPMLPTVSNPYQHLPQGAMQESLANHQGYQPHQFDQYAEVQQQRLQQQQQQQQRQQQQHHQQQQQQHQEHPSHQQHQHHQQGPSQASPPARSAPPQGIVNPMFAMADFGNTNHAYQDHYVPPTYKHQQLQGHGLGLGLFPLQQAGNSFV